MLSAYPDHSLSQLATTFPGVVTSVTTAVNQCRGCLLCHIAPNDDLPPATSFMINIHDHQESQTIRATSGQAVAHFLYTRTAHVVKHSATNDITEPRFWIRILRGRTLALPFVTAKAPLSRTHWCCISTCRGPFHTENGRLQRALGVAQERAAFQVPKMPIAM